MEEPIPGNGGDAFSKMKKVYDACMNASKYVSFVILLMELH